MLSSRRFRQVPTFGDGVIRAFANNTSEMKKLAARDFEDILQVIPSSPNFSSLNFLTTSLQCAMPVFEGLFPASHDMIVQSLLYRFAQWHALAKLRIHSDSTLGFLEETFKILSKQLRKFRDSTCAAFVTVELPKEKAARQRKFAKSNNAPPDSSVPRVKRFNISTYKFHAMGDYVQTIKLFGTTDSFTTQIVSSISLLAPKYLNSSYRLGRASAQNLEVILSTDEQAGRSSPASEARAQASCVTASRRSSRYLPLK